MSSCVIHQRQLMAYEGEVFLVTDCKVCVNFDIVNKSKTYQSAGCFAHVDGHDYEVGDGYPDWEKHATFKPVPCEWVKDSHRKSEGY